MSNKIRKVINKLPPSITPPFYLFDETSILDNYSKLNSLSAKFDCAFATAYSFKTNPLDNLLSTLNRAGAWAETTSLIELKLATNHQFRNIIFNGIFKTNEEIQYASNVGAIIILDGENQVGQLLEMANHLDKTIKVGFRISSFPILKDNGIRFGFNADAPSLKYYIKTLHSHPNINICCLHTHLGTDINDPIYFKLSLERLFHISLSLKSFGVEIRYFDVGGGIPSSPSKKWIKFFSKGLLHTHDIISNPNKTIIIEPGRFLVETCGVLVTKVIDIRDRLDTKGKDIVVNAGSNCFMGEGTYNIAHNCYRLQQKTSNEQFTYRIVGPLCSSDDILLHSFECNQIEIDDLLIFEGIGAYDYSTAYNFSRRLPPTCFIDNSGELITIA